MRTSRHLWLALGALPVALGEVTGLVHLQGARLPLERIAPLAPAGYDTVVRWVLLVAAPIFVGSVISLVAQLLQATGASSVARWGWPIGLELLLLVGGAGAAGVALAALLALLAVSVAQAGSLILVESPTAGIAAGLALAGAMVILPAAALSGLAVAMTLVAAVARRGRLQAGLAFAAVVSFPPIVLAVSAPFLDWRLAGNTVALRGFVAAGWPGSSLIAFGALVALVGVILGVLLPERMLPVALAIAVSSGSVAGGVALMLSVMAGLAAFAALVPWWGVALRGLERLGIARRAALNSD
jgi:hypothetical protein